MTTKEQERKALEQIKKIVESLGADSYIGTAFEGCFEIAEENIENDFAISAKDRWEKAERDAEDFHRQAQYYSDEAMKQEAKAESAKKALEELRETYRTDLEAHKKAEIEIWNNYRDKEEKLATATATLEAKELEIIKLKAKLYDLMTK